MKFSYSQQLDADLDTVMKMYTDPAYHEQLQSALGSMNVTQLDHSDDGDDFEITLGYSVKSEVPLPGFAKKILGETTDVEQTESWNRSSGRGRVAVRMKSLPGSLRCETSLEADGDSCRKVFDWTVEVKVPLVGGKIEKLIADDIARKDPIEAKAANALLDSYR